MRPVRALLATAFFFSATLHADPGVLRRGTSADALSLDPAVSASNFAAPIINDLYEGFFGKDAALGRIPGQAEKWTVSDDGLTYTFTLRKGLLWSDGKPITSADFVYGYQRLFDPQTASPVAGQFFQVVNAREVVAGKVPPDQVGITAPDERTVVIRLRSPAPWFVELVGSLPVSPVPRHVIEKYGREWTRPENMVTNGAYTLAERVPQTVTKLRKNKRYWQADQVRSREVYWYPTQDLATSLRRFRAGELDQILNFPPEEIDWLRKNMPKQLQIAPSLGIYYVILNTRVKPFDDVRVRRALYLAVDQAGIANRLLRTGVKPAPTFVGPDFSNYDGVRLPELEKPISRRQASARELLKAAGFGPGKPLEFEYVYDTNEENRKVAVALASMWQAVGVRAKPVNVDFGQLNRQVRTGDYTVARWVYFAGYDDPHALLTLFAGDNTNNYAGWKNARFDELLAASNRETNPAARRKLLEDAERVLVADAPLIPIFDYVRRYLVSPRVEGWVTSERGPTPSRYLYVAK